jgi:hypothetical protein
MVVWQGDLYVVGDFTHAGGVEVSYVARWDGSTWSDVGGGVSMIGVGPTGLRGVDVHNGDLVIVGALDFAGGVEAINIARWDGAVWSPVGSGSDPIGGFLNLRQAALAVASYQGLLYVGADFSEAVNKKASALAVWDGQRWRPVDQGLAYDDEFLGGPHVRDLEVCGGSLLMGGQFDEANNEITDNMARYTGCGQPTGAGTDNTSSPFGIVSVSPNPFNPSTTVRFTLPAAMPVTAEIWSAAGARIRALANEKPFGPGDNQLTWDGRTDQGSPAASGVYFIRLKTRLGEEIRRAVLLK